MGSKTIKFYTNLKSVNRILLTLTNAVKFILFLLGAYSRLSHSGRVCAGKLQDKCINMEHGEDVGLIPAPTDRMPDFCSPLSSVETLGKAMLALFVINIITCC